MKILFHAINGVGLGHLVRTLEIAKELKKIRKDIEIIFVTNSKFPKLIEKEGFRFYQLKLSTEKVIEGKISYESYLKYNSLALKNIIKKELPDMALFDSEFNKDFVEFCVKEKIKTAYVLRNKNKDGFDSLISNEILKNVDLIIVPHNKEEVDNEQLSILENYNVSFTGPIIKLSNNIKKVKNKDLKVLITFAGGSDVKGSRKLFSQVCKFLSDLRKINSRIDGLKIDINIVTGPYFNKEKYDLSNFKSEEFDYNLSDSIYNSDIVICPAGYNTINEIIFSKVPSIVIPLETKEDDQFLRAKLLENKGCIKIGNDNILDQIKEIVSASSLTNMKESFPNIKNGSSLAAKELNSVLGFKENIGFLRGEWLPLSERFIFDEVNKLKFYSPNVFCLSNNENFENNFNVFSNKKFELLWKPSYPLINKNYKKIYDSYILWNLNIIKSKHIKLLHAEFMTDAFFFLKLKKFTNVKLVVSVRGYDLYANNLDYSQIFKEADIFLVRSNQMKADLIEKGCNKNKIKIHHSGIHLSNKKLMIPDKNKIINILMVGRFVEKKGTIFGLDVALELFKRNPNIQLDIIGDGPLKEEIIEKIKKSPFSKRIRLHGEITNQDVLKIMSKTHILFQPSLTANNGDKEGIPNSIMEAMNNSLVVVGSDNGSISEIVNTGDTGFLFKENNFSDALDKLEYVINNIFDLDNIRTNAFNLVRNEFNIIKQNCKLESIYGELLKEKFSAPYHNNYSSLKQGGNPSSFRVDIHPIKGCDSYCVMCDNWKNDRKEYFTLEKLKKFISELKKSGIDQIRFHGQEPTLFSDLNILIDYAKDLGFYVGLKTNANNLDKEYCEKLKRLDKLYLSIDSPNKLIHNKMRGNKSSFDNNLIAINNMKEISPNIIIESNSVVTRLNYESLIDMPNLAFDNGLRKVSFVLPNTKNSDSIGNVTLNKEEMYEFFLTIVPKIVEKCISLGLDFDFSPFFSDLVLSSPENIYFELNYNQEKYYEEIDNFILQKYGKKFYEKYGCYGNLDHLSLNFDGNVYPCCVVERKEFNSVGNILTESFKDIWEDTNYSNLRRDVFRTKGKCCHHAEYCGSNFKARKELFNEIRKLEKKDEDKAVSYLYELDSLFKKNKEIINKLVEDKLKRTIEFSIKKLPFYSKINIDKKNLIFSFNPLSKKDVRDNIHNGMINPISQENFNFVMDRTSGSIDKTVPFAYLKDHKRYIRMIYPFTINSDWDWGQKFFIFSTLHCSRERCSTDDLPFYVNREKIATSQDIFNDKKILKNTYDKIKETQNYLIHADPFYLSAFAKYLNDNNLSIKFKSISSTYEILLPSIKKYLEKTFECRVFDNYGSSEFGPIAFECEFGNKHIYEDTLFIEIIKNKTNYFDPDVGDILVTSLDNNTMPLIRYEVGDLGKFIDKRCDCGRNNKILEVYGRKDSIISLNNQIYTERDIGKLMDLEGILVYQIRKDSNHFFLDIILSDKSLKDEIETKIKSIFGKDTKVNFVESITPEISGKFKTILFN